MPQSTVEVEVKIAVPDADAARNLILGLGFTVSTPRQFESNTVWDTADLSLKASGEIVRLREYGGQRLLTYKGPAQPGKHKSREELESDVSSLAALERIFTRLGLAPSFRYEKFRTEFRRPGGAGVITLDETPIGTFLELEGEPAWIDGTALELGFTQADYVTSSYAALYLAHCRASGVEPSHMVFEKDRNSPGILP